MALGPYSVELKGFIFWGNLMIRNPVLKENTKPKGEETKTFLRDSSYIFERAPVPQHLSQSISYFSQVSWASAAFLSLFRPGI